MGQDALVMGELDGGRELVERLTRAGFDVSLAFWLKETDAGQWYLYLSSPVFDDKGPAVAYRIVMPIVEGMPELGIDPFSIKVVGVNDSIATAARAVIKPRIPDSPFAVKNPKPYAGMTRFAGATLGGVSIDGAYIYPPSRSGTST